MSEIKINIVEVASELAVNATKDEAFTEHGIQESDLTIDDGEQLVYTDFAQDIHNRWYDYFYAEIEKLKK